MPEDDDQGIERIPARRIPFDAYNVVLGRDAVREEIKNYVNDRQLVTQAQAEAAVVRATADLRSEIERLRAEMRTEIQRRWSKSGVAVAFDVNTDTDDEARHRALMEFWKKASKDPEWFDLWWQFSKQQFAAKMASKGRLGRLIGPVSGAAGAAAAVAGFLYEYFGRR